MQLGFLPSWKLGLRHAALSTDIIHKLDLCTRASCCGSPCQSHVSDAKLATLQLMFDTLSIGEKGSHILVKVLQISICLHLTSVC